MTFYSDTKIPTHIAIIPDGNRRWARKNGLPIMEGHKKGIENFKKISLYCKKKGIKIITFFAFSTENWKREKFEVNYLMRLFKEYFKKYKDYFKKEKMKVRIIGDRENLPSDTRDIIEEIEERTKDNKERIVNICLNYGGRLEIVEAVKKILREEPKKLDLTTFRSYLWTKDIPDPDLVIRTGGERRISNFLLWQLAYSELYFSRKLWPDFTNLDLARILKDYQKRERRFGK